jgi:DNA topoisomerase-2
VRKNNYANQIFQLFFSEKTKNQMSEKYEWLEGREHVIRRPDTYCGPTTVAKIEGHAFFVEKDKLKSKNIECETSPGLIKLFDEVLTNAMDNSKRDLKQKFIKAFVFEQDGSFMIVNDGSTIPVQFWKDTQRYVPEILVYELMSGQNFKDQREMVGGRNGLGVKITNYLSEYFEILIVNVEDGKRYQQKFRKNASVVEAPKITKLLAKDKHSSTTIIWKPDYARFGMTLPLQLNVIELLKTRAYDAAACTSSTLSVFFNNEKLSIKNLKDYTIALGGDWIGKEEIIVDGKVLFEVCLSHVRKEEHEHGKCIGFVNGLQCSAGTHVELVYRRIIESMNAICKKKMKQSCNIRPQLVKDSLIVVINANFSNPSFSSQTKEKCDLKVDKFGFMYQTLSNSLIKSIEKSTLVENIIQSLKEQEDKAVQKSVQQTKRQKCNIPKYQRALKAQANLYLTEGDSAMAMALAGFSVVGKEHNGVFPLRGKLVNVSGMSAKSALEHQEIMYLTQILKLEPNKEYDDSNTQNLPYRHIIIFTDQDTDGSHIMGLIMTFVREFFPSILKLWPNFIKRFATHIVKAQIGTERKSFFSLQEYKIWLGDRKPSKVKYYKGLGTSTDEEAREYFHNINTHLTDIVYTGEDSSEAIQLFYASNKADDRKKVLKSIDTESFVNYGEEDTTFEFFCHNELIHHCAADCIRSIANGIDGLKPSQRKILHTIRMIKGKEVKVSELAANTTSKTDYLHGEASLIGAIMMMAQTFIGTNNIAYLRPNGQFGSRMTQRDKGLAQPRYVHTQTAEIASYMFRLEDDQVLELSEDDGKQIEPTFFVPIVANVLINGCEGIGTGYKTKIPNFNPIEVIRATKQFIRFQTTPELLPYYHGFLGTVTKSDQEDYIFTGLYEIKDKKKEVHVTELPPTVWTDKYTEWLHKNLPPYFVDFEDRSNKYNVFIILKYKADVDILAKNIVEDLKLYKKGNLSFMNLYDAQGKLHKYNSPHEIIEAHAKVRIELYKKRLQFQIQSMSTTVNILNEKARFLVEVVNGTIQLTNKKKSALRECLRQKNYFEHDNFLYLLKMDLDSLTLDEVEKIKRQATEMTSHLEHLKKKTPESVWEHELDELEQKYTEYVTDISKSCESNKFGNNSKKRKALHVK